MFVIAQRFILDNILVVKKFKYLRSKIFGLKYTVILKCDFSIKQEKEYKLWC